MAARLDYTKVAPGVYHAMAALERYLHECGPEESLLHLIKLREPRTLGAGSFSLRVYLSATLGG